jgi:hypothetical protein
MKDVARIELGTENYFQNSRLNSSSASTIAIFQIPGSMHWRWPKQYGKRWLNWSPGCLLI